MINSNYSFGLERDEKQLKANNRDFRKWTNPLEVQLPFAPSLKIYCVYGYGLETEVRISFLFSLTISQAIAFLLVCSR